MLFEAEPPRYRAILIASDHAGLDLKSHLIGRFPFLPWQDLGTNETASVDYPDYATKLCEALEPQLPFACGLLICGSGQGMAMRANRYAFIRAALCWNEEASALSRRHNDANVLCLAARLTDVALAERITQTFLSTDFEGGRHQGRLVKLSRPC